MPTYLVRPINQDIVRIRRGPKTLQLLRCKRILGLYRTKTTSALPSLKSLSTTHPSPNIIPLIQRIEPQINIIIRTRRSLEHNRADNTTAILGRVVRVVPATAELRDVEGVGSGLARSEGAFC